MKAAGRKKRFMAMQAVHSNKRKWAVVLLFLSFGTISGRLPGMVRERDPCLLFSPSFRRKKRMRFPLQGLKKKK